MHDFQDFFPEKIIGFNFKIEKLENVSCLRKIFQNDVFEFRVLNQIIYVQFSIPTTIFFRWHPPSHPKEMRDV